MSEFEQAKNHADFVVKKNGMDVFQTSHGGGVSPVMLAILAHGEDLNGSAVHCNRIGQAAARLLVEANVSSVNADVLSEPAYSVFQQSAVKVNCGSILAATDYTNDRSEIIIDALSREFPDTESLFEELRGRVLRTIYRAERPTDSRLLDERNPRSGGGGT